MNINRNKLRKITLLIFLIICALPLTNAYAQKKYAILVSAGQTVIDNQMYHSEYWYDLFQMYQMLIDEGFDHNNIFVLYGNGNDFNSTHQAYQTASAFPNVNKITDYPNDDVDINNIFNWLGTGNIAQGIPQIQPGDFIYFWWMGHGRGCACDDYEAKIENTGDYISDDQFAAWFDLLPECVIKSAFIMTCRSGGLVNEFDNVSSTIHTAAECCTDSDSDTYDVVHAELSYHLANALREQQPNGTAVVSDSNGDGLVSVEEANNYVHTNTVLSNTQIADYRYIAPSIYIANAQPDANVLKQGVYSRDYLEDDGTEPSDTSYVWYAGPDLWVRHSQDGYTMHQDPEYGQTNSVYARIHNIGCQTLDNVALEYSWSTVSAWSNPAAWNNIDNITINGLQSGTSQVNSVTWNSVPAPGKYCLHTKLNAPGDPADTHGIAYMDNNQVQINVVVEDNWGGWGKNYRWFVENPSIEDTVVDLFVHKINFVKDAEISIRIPNNIQFEGIEGGEIIQTRDGRILKIASSAKRAVIRGIPLKAGARHQAVLSIVTPKGQKIGNMHTVKVSERIKGEDMGGIVFHTRSASKEKVLEILFTRMSNVFKAIGKKLDHGAVRKIAKLTQESSNVCRHDDPEKLQKVIGRIVEMESQVEGLLLKHLNKTDKSLFRASLERARQSVKTGELSEFVTAQDDMLHSFGSLL